MDQGLDNAVETGAIPPGITEEAAEKLIPQSTVDKAVKHAKNLAYEQGKKEVLMQLQAQQQEQQPVNAPVNPQGSQNLGGMQSLTPDQVQKMIDTHAQQQAQQYHAQNIANEFLAKLSNGKDKYPDFDEKMESLDLSTIPQIVQLANTVENTDDVMYELASNPNKLVTLLNLTNFGNGRLAYLETKKLSDSIKQNQTALQQPVPPEPLSQLKPSNVGTDNGALSIRELRKQQHLRS